MQWILHLLIIYTTLTFAALYRDEQSLLPRTRSGEHFFVLKKNISKITKQEFELTLPVKPSKIFLIGPEFHCYLFKNINDTLVSYITSLPAVLYTEPNKLFKATAIQYNPTSWGLKRVWNRNLPLLNQYVYSDNAGVGVDVYIIDSGIYIAHNDLPNAIWGATFNSEGGDTDCDGHGTHLAGVVGGTKYGVAKSAKLIAVKVLDCRGSGYLEEILAGLEWVVKEHIFKSNKNGENVKSVANLALGGSSSQSLADAVDAAVDVGIHFSVAAGNNMGNSCSYSPSDSKKGIIVAAADIDDFPASFSNAGQCITVWAPGVDIVSADAGSSDAEMTMTGTSVATPHVTGVIALYLADSTSTISPSAMKSLLQSRATQGVIDYVSYTNRPTQFFQNSTISRACSKDSDCSWNQKCCDRGFGGNCVTSSLICCGTGSCRSGEACCDEKDWSWGCCFAGNECHNEKKCRNSYITDTPNLNLYSNPPSDD